MRQKLKKPEDEKEHRSNNSVYVAIAGEVVNRRSVHLKNIVLNGKVRASDPLLHIHAKRCTQAEKRASRTIGTFGFCLDTKPKAEKPKEPNFSQRSTETRILTERNKRYK